MKTLIYILGHNYSGSTLLALLLSGHSKISTTGEIVGPPHFEQGRNYNCSCGFPIHSCHFYQELEERIDHRQFVLSRNYWGTRLLSQPPSLVQRLLFGSLRNGQLETGRDSLCRIFPFARLCISQKTELLSRFVKTACEILDTDFLVDSSKVPMQLQILKQIPGVQLKVLHLVRHPAGCVHSSIKHHGHSVALSAEFWRRNLETCFRQLRRIETDSWMRVRYEDICDEPEFELHRICTFLGIKFEEEMLSLVPENTHIVGNDMRFENCQKVVLNETWKTAFSAKELDKIVQLVSRTNLNICSYLL
jgi:hypothetical protein